MNALVNKVNLIQTKEGNTMKTLNTLTQIIRSINTDAVKSTAHFNAAYEQAERAWAHELRTNVPFHERELSKLSREIKDGYRQAVSEFVAEFAHEVVETKNIATFLEQVKHLEQWNNFCERALHKTQRRMHMKNLHDIPLLTIREGETWKTIDDIEMLLSTLEDSVTLNQLLISNSGSLAYTYMKDLLELEGAFPKEWELLTNGVIGKAQSRVKRKQSSKTDEIILGQSTMTTYMMPFVLNRFLGEIAKQEVRLDANIERMEDMKAAAIKETDGRAGEHRDRKVDGYSDLSRQELGPKGYANTAAVASGQTASYYDDGNAEFGIVGINQMRDNLQALAVFEDTIIELMDHKLSALFVSAEVLHPAKPTYAYKRYSDEQYTPITDKAAAISYLAEQRKQFIEQQRKERLVTREDTARYDAMNMHVPTFNLDL